MQNRVKDVLCATHLSKYDGSVQKTICLIYPVEMAEFQIVSNESL